MAKIQRARQTSPNPIIRIFVQDNSKTTGAGLTGLTNASGSLTVNIMRELDSTVTVYTGANLVTITTLGTYSAPAAGKAGFKEVDATNLPGWYEIQFVQAVFGTADASKFVSGMAFGATNMAPCPFEIELSAVDIQDGVHFGITALPNAAAAASGGLLISGTNSGTTTLGALTCTGTFTISDGISVSRSTGNSSAIIAAGSGTGHGISATSGNGITGNGINCISISTNGNGFSGTGTGTGNGMFLQGGGSANGDGLHAVGGAGASNGIRGIGGASSGAGIRAETAAANGNGFEGQGSGTGDGFSSTGGSTGNGIHAVSGGGATGDGILAASGATNGNGMTLTHAGTGKDLNAATSAPLAVSATNSVTVGTNNDKTGYSLTQSFPSNFASLAITAGGAVTLNSGQLFIKKNTQITITFPMTDSTTHAPKTGLGAAGVTCQRSIDGAAVGACANTNTELSGGLYSLVLAAGDTNGAMITYIFSAAGADTRFIGVVTQA